MATVIRIKPLHYVHILDNNSNVTRLVKGPATITTREHERAVTDTLPMLVIPLRSYAIVQNPVERDASGAPCLDRNGNYVLRHGDTEIRFHGPPFPLYPGEQLLGNVSPLMVVGDNSALRLRCTRPFSRTDADGKVVEQRVPGEEWLWPGPGTYTPQVEVEVAEVVRAVLVGPLEALRVQARREFVQKDGTRRCAGEEWLHSRPGLYMPGVHEAVKSVVKAVVLTNKVAVHLRALQTYTDRFDVQRKAGAEWLVTSAQADYYIPDVCDLVVNPQVPITVLSKRQFCIVNDPIGADGLPARGEKKLIRGPAMFFLQPGETLSNGIQSIPILAADEAFLLNAREEFVDADGTRHQPGDRWMVCGPCEYICPLQAALLEQRRLIALDKNEGIYVRNIDTGRVRTHIGSSYMLTANEELWSKQLPDAVEELLVKYGTVSGKRDPTRVVSLRVPNNTVVQIYDFKTKTPRVVFGPDLVQLGPDEHFTLLSLSGDKPKRPHVIKDLCLQLGPEFSTDLLVVETADHARLQLRLSYNWQFNVDRSKADRAYMLFSVPDFIGDFCKAIASRVRGAVAQASFDEFHRNSARLIRSAVFGLDDEGRVKHRMEFEANLLMVTNIDIQSVEPVDQRTRDSLQKSVQQAIEITTNSQEASARHSAQREEQLARGRLERQRISDEAESEKSRSDLVQHQTTCAMLETTGQAQAEAYGKAEAAKIVGKASVEIAGLKASLLQITTDLELELQDQREGVSLKHQSDLNGLEVRRESEVTRIDAEKFRDIVASIGPQTIAAIARCGPEMQAKLLEGLGLQSVLITDGSSPINLFDTAQGMIPGMASAASK